MEDGQSAVTTLKMIADALAALSLGSEAAEPCLAKLPDLVLERIAQHVRDTQEPLGNPQAQLVALALTCKAVAAAIIPRVLYSRLQVPSLASLSPLESTLRLNAKLAHHVRVIALSAEFMDWYQYDLEGGLTEAVKYNSRGSVPCTLRLPFLGSTTERSLLMAWLTTLAQLCPNLVGIDLGPMVCLPKTLTIGFRNLAEVLRPRGGWFRSPNGEGVAVSSIFMYTPANVNGTGRRPMPYVVTGIDWGLKVMDVELIQTQAALISPELNLCQLEALIPGGHEELAKWRIRHVRIFDDLGPDEPYSADYRDFAFARQGSFVFDLKKQRMLTPATPAAGAPKGQSTPTKRGKKKTGAGKKVPAVAPGKPAGNLVIEIGTPDEALDIVNKHNLDKSQCVAIKSYVDLPPETDHPMVTRIIASRTYAFSRCLLEPLASSPWTSVTNLDFGPPLFTNLNHAESLKLLEPLASAFPNVTRLVLRLLGSSIAEVLLAVDPFVRRSPNIGPPLRELGVLRMQGGLGVSAGLTSPVSTLQRTALNATKPTHGHLRSLFLSSQAYMPHEVDSELNTVLIHPGLAVGLERLHTTGVRLLIAPSKLVGPRGASFPRPRGSQSAAMALENAMLPNLRRLYLSFILNSGISRKVDLHTKLPTCPQLESIVLDINAGFMQFRQAQSIQDIKAILAEYPRLRHAAIMSAALAATDLAQLYSHFFGTTDLASRPLPRLLRLLVRNVDTPLAPNAQDAVGLWVMGTAGGTLRLSDVPVPDVNFKMLPALLPNNDWVGSKPNDITQGLIVPRLGAQCACKKQRMGAVWRPGSQLLAWAVPTVANGTVVVCKDCVAQATDARLKVDAPGKVVAYNKVRRLIEGVVGAQQLALHFGAAMWAMYIR